MTTLASTLVFGAILPDVASAQATGFEPRPSRRQLDLQTPGTAETSPPVAAAPSGAGPRPRGPDGAPRFLLRAVRFEGATALDAGALQALAEPYLGRMVSARDLWDLRLAATRLYIDSGYPTSGVLLPDQTIIDGVVVFRVVEGRLGDIRIDGAGRLDPEWLAARLRRGLAPPLEAQALRDNILLLIDDESVARIEAALQPSGTPGVADLSVVVVPAPPLRLDLFTANDRSPSVGGIAAGGRVTGRSLLFTGDRTTVAAEFAAGLQDLEFGYAVPVDPGGAELFAAIELSRSTVVEEPFDVLDIESDSVTAALGGRAPLFRRPGESAWLSLSLEHSWSRSTLLGEPFPFSPAAGDDGETRITPLRAALDYARVDRDSALSLRSTLSLGLPIFGAASTPDGDGDGRFVSWLGQAGLLHRLGDGDVLARIDLAAQLTPDSLPPIERMALGGLDSVRGYRVNRLVRDNGLMGRLEGEVPLATVQIADLAESAADGALRAVPFLDAGYGWNKGDSGDWISGVGLGLRWRIAPGARAEFYAAAPLVSRRGRDEDSLQDFGIHFRIAVGFE